MSFVSELRESVDKARPDIEKKEAAKRERIKLAKEKLFYHLSEKYLEDIHSAIIRAKYHGKSEQHMNHDRFDFKTNVAGIGTPAQLMREWIEEVKNPNSKFVITDIHGNSINLSGINAYVWNNRKFTTEYSWGTRIAGCQHGDGPCNCLKLLKNDLGFKVSLNNGSLVTLEYNNGFKKNNFCREVY